MCKAPAAAGATKVSGVGSVGVQHVGDRFAEFVVRAVHAGAFGRHGIQSVQRALHQYVHTFVNTLRPGSTIA